MKRKYFGTIHLKKAYVGDKSVNLVVEPEESIKLAKLILEAGETNKEFDLAVYWTKKRKTDKKISMTITQGEK